MSEGSACRRLALGTVQSGLDYGVTNVRGRVPEQDVREILELATSAGVDLLDCAHLYGESEVILGLLPETSSFRVVSKTPKFSGTISVDEVRYRLRAALETSLVRLNRTYLDGLLIHDADDLLGPLGPGLWAEMEAAQASGLVGKIGISIYDGAQIDAALDRYPIGLVQLPFNPLDRRLLEGGQIDRLTQRGIEIHARSLFLQGLLLEDVEKIDARFGPLVPAIAGLHEWATARRIDRPTAILALCLQIEQIDRFVVGVTSPAELEEIVFAAENAEGVHDGSDFASAAPQDPRYLNPARWPELG